MNLEHYKTIIRNYKLKVAKRYISIDAEKIDRITPQDRFLVSIKYDGHYYGLVHNKEETYFMNASGKVVNDIALVKTVRETLNKKGITNVCLAGELYKPKEGRSRHSDLRSALTTKDDDISFAPFALLELNGEPVMDKNSFEIHEMMNEFVPATGHFHQIEAKEVTSRSEIKEIFDQSIIDNHEGVVVKGLEFATYKVKPKYTFDAVVIGFVEEETPKGMMMRDLLLAFRKEDGSFQVFTHIGLGFKDVDRLELAEHLATKTVESDYIEVASNKVGFRMVKPEKVMEFSCLDVIAENSKGNALYKANLNYEDGKGYLANFNQASVSVTAPVFLKFRDDKTTEVHDVRFSQVDEVLELEKREGDNGVPAELPKSTVERREVFVKATKKATMLRKFLIIKTNKEAVSDEYPAYVFHLTDVSTGRKDPLKREIRVSNSKEQIYSLYEESLAKNIKRGWDPV